MGKKPTDKAWGEPPEGPDSHLAKTGGNKRGRKVADLKGGASAIVIILLIGIASLTQGQKRSENPHDFRDDQCPTCHGDNPTGGEGRMSLARSVTRLCMECHDDLEATPSHPVDVRPRRVTVPADMPLSKNGQITCSTCHDIHMPYRTPSGSKSHFLRHRGPGRQFCMECHDGEKTGTPAGHSGVVPWAHFKSGLSGRSLAAPLDPLSRECLSCHDGSVGESSDIWTGTEINGRRPTGPSPDLHPIGLDYENARKRRGGLRPRFGMDKRIKLFQGKVTCASCHDPYSRCRSQLAMDNRGSRLCLGCHLKWRSPEKRPGAPFAPRL